MINLDQYSLKVKNGHVIISVGVLMEEKVCKIPLALVPEIKWDKEAKGALINELIRKNELSTVLALSGEKPKDEKSAGQSWRENQATGGSE